MNRITSLSKCPTACPRKPLSLRIAAVIIVFYSMCRIKDAPGLKQNKIRFKCQPNQVNSTIEFGHNVVVQLLG